MKDQQITQLSILGVVSIVGLIAAIGLLSTPTTTQSTMPNSGGQDTVTGQVGFGGGGFDEPTQDDTSFDNQPTNNEQQADRPSSTSNENEEIDWDALNEGRSGVDMDVIKRVLEENTELHETLTPQCVDAVHEAYSSTLRAPRDKQMETDTGRNHIYGISMLWGNKPTNFNDTWELTQQINPSYDSTNPQRKVVTNSEAKEEFLSYVAAESSVSCANNAVQILLLGTLTSNLDNLYTNNLVEEAVKAYQEVATEPPRNVCWEAMEEDWSSSISEPEARIVSNMLLLNELANIYSKSQTGALATLNQDTLRGGFGAGHQLLPATFEAWRQQAFDGDEQDLSGAARYAFDNYLDEDDKRRATDCRYWRETRRTAEVSQTTSESFADADTDVFSQDDTSGSSGTTTGFNWG